MSAHEDTFAMDNLPPADLWPKRDFSTLPELNYPQQLNCAVELLDKMVDQGFADSPVLHTSEESWSYGDLLRRANQIAHVLTDDFGLKPGNRVLLRGPNNPMLAACWFGVLKAGGICVTTMPLLREHELTQIVEKAEVSHALCDGRWADELRSTEAKCSRLSEVSYFSSGGDGLEALMDTKPESFDSISTDREDIALIAFTSGTTGSPKATMHAHSDVMAICDCFPRSTLKPTKDDVFCGTPPFAFTFGLGALLLFPMRFGASSVLLEKPALDGLLDAIQRFKATICFTSPTAYRAMLDNLGTYDLSSLKRCVSAGETLPLPTFQAWEEKTGIRIIDGIGATEMLHIFISAAGEEICPGATGKPIPGYEAKVVDMDGNELPKGTIGLLAVRGPTGCRYLSDERQKQYVRNGWNYTGDAYLEDDDGYFWFQARADDMIISSGYNISGIEVERVLLSHPKVSQCGVVGVPDDERGNIVKAFIVLREPGDANDATTKELQDFVKGEIAPYKYPRAIKYMSELPCTETGKLQRFKLRQME